MHCPQPSLLLLSLSGSVNRSMTDLYLVDNVDLQVSTYHICLSMSNFFFNQRNNGHGGGEISQWIRTLGVVPENLISS